MCAGDLTLEWPREEEDGRRFAVDGWGVGHVCRGWVSILMMMTKRFGKLRLTCGRMRLWSLWRSIRLLGMFMDEPTRKRYDVQLPTRETNDL